MVLSDESFSAVVSTSLHQNEMDKDDFDEQNSDVDKLNSKSESLVLVSSPRYDLERDMIVTGAKTINYIGSGVVSGDCYDRMSFDLPNSVMFVPVHSVASSISIGAKEAFTWSVRWFLRFILDGTVFSEFQEWFPTRIKKSISPELVTVSWGMYVYFLN